LSACLGPESTAKGDERNNILKIRYADPGENKPYTGSDSYLNSNMLRETPVKPSFSVPVENTPKYRSVFQNTADLHLTQCPLMTL
jgi:hypothetical protein